MKVRLRSNCRAEIDADVQNLLNSFELKFRGSDNQPYLQLPNAQSGFVECIYVQNTPENREQYHPKNKGFNNVLFVTTNKNRETVYSYSAMRLEEIERPYNNAVWFAVDCALHKDYLTKLATRQLQQRQQAESEAREAQQRHTETLHQIEQLKELAINAGLTLALDYITSPDEEE